jgi:hypothetical protein
VGRSGEIGPDAAPQIKAPTRRHEGRCDSGFGDAHGLSTRGSSTGVREIGVQRGWNGLEASVVRRAIEFASRDGIEYVTWREFGVPAEVHHAAGYPANSTCFDDGHRAGDECEPVEATPQADRARWGCVGGRFDADRFSLR